MLRWCCESAAQSSRSQRMGRFARLGDMVWIMPNASHRLLTTLLISALLSGCAVRAQPVPSMAPAPNGRPTLVVFLTIDQLRGDYLDRFGPQFQGGLKRLAGGTVFPNAYHDHAITETAPGHAATLSGRFPVHTGIAANSAGVFDRSSPLIGSSDPGASPARFKGTTLVDWMRAANPATRFLSVSRKDRAAILPIGRSRGDVYWYAANGTFTQSRYYSTALPPWVQRFNAAQHPMRYAGWRWVPLLADSLYAEPDSVAEEDQGREVTFPHVVSEDSTIAAASLGNFPVMDELTLRFALTGVQELQLGTNTARTDLLAISLSTTDAVGHRFGPDSRELHDQLLRLDRSLGDFLDSLFVVRDPARTLVVLTSDHGMTPYPDRLSPVTPNPGAARVDVIPVFDAFLRRLAGRGVDTLQVALDGGTLQIGDTSSFVRTGIAVDSTVRALAREFTAIPGVARVDLLSDLATRDTVADAIARRWLHQFAPGGNVRFVTTLQQFNYWSGTTVAMHGSPWDQDAWVPIVFLGPGIPAARIERRVRVVDIAPTLARLLGINPSEKLDGVVLPEVLQP
jgi:predicted AlkP superfamily pyrophosphatase or phosphodiesterase